MGYIDITILIFYLVGVVITGSLFSKIESTNDMFNAGGRSPWWLSGISAFMTAFSAGSFVIWGGVAYSNGAVAISILMSLGISSFLVGRFLAGRWKSFGYDSAAKFLTDRFGRSIVQFYTLLQGLVGVFTMGGAVYALSVIICTLTPLPADHLLVDANTGRLSVDFVSLILCIIIILITSGGGLWAVLVTDTVQFIILLVSIIAVIPLMLNRIGDLDNFVTQVPDDYFNFVNKEFSLLFLIGWIIIYFFKFGGEWGFIQRFSCVPSEKDARKSSYLFGFLYIVSPIIWMLPPMLYRAIDPSAHPEHAYILACQLVLPSGMLGLMIAAMCSATTSSATTYINVFAGAFTSEFYQGIFRKNATEKELVFAGRIFTILLGAVTLAGAYFIPRWGTYMGYVISSVALLSGPLILPTIWGIISKKLSLRMAWLITFISIVIVALMKIGIQRDGFLFNYESIHGIVVILSENERVFEMVVGIFVPLILLSVDELFRKRVDEGWIRINQFKLSNQESVDIVPSTYPIKLCGTSFMIVGFILVALSLVQLAYLAFLLTLGGILLALGGILLYIYRRSEKENIVR